MLVELEGLKVEKVSGRGNSPTIQDMMCDL